MRVRSVMGWLAIATGLADAQGATERNGPSEQDSFAITTRAVTPSDDTPLAELLAAQSAAFRAVLADPDHRVQIRWIRIERDAHGRPSFERHEYGVDPRAYFYPASTVKLPAAVVALEELQRLRETRPSAAALGLDTPMITGVAEPWQSGADSDPDNPDGRPSIGQYVRKVFLVSDNDAYNRLFEFVGVDRLNDSLARLGLRHTRIFHRLAVRREPWHGRHANPIAFLDGVRPVLEIPARVSVREFRSPVPIRLGRGFVEDGVVVAEPKDFAELNSFPLADQQELLLALLFPESVPEAARPRIAESDRNHLLRAMGEYPRESGSPERPPPDYPDGYVKFLILGGTEPEAPPGLRILDKSGMAYGFLTDNAYVADFTSRTEFLLAATIHVNADGIYNDDRYEYDTIGLPFLRDLGRAVLEFERSRPPAHQPDLSPLALLFSPSDSRAGTGSPTATGPSPAAADSAADE